jgi:methionine-S-sulfoxide reductase
MRKIVWLISILLSQWLLLSGKSPKLPPQAPPAQQNILPTGDFAKDAPKGLEVASLAGGCFWGMEEIIRKIPGVIDTQVGYAGGNTSAPSYKEVSSGKTGHAESIQVLFNPKKLSYQGLLTFFFRMHDPTTLNQQGNDKGTQYRSVIFAYGNSQEKVARDIIKKVDAKRRWKKPVVTQVMPAAPFWRAEPEHQDYLQKNPKGYTCHYLRDE